MSNIRDASSKPLSQQYFGRRELASFGVIVSFVTSVFVLLFRYLCHPRRIRKHLPHDVLLYLSTLFALVTTICLVTLLNIVPKNSKIITSATLKAYFAGMIPYSLAVGTTRMAAVSFSLAKFGSRFSNPRRLYLFRLLCLFCMFFLCAQTLTTVLAGAFLCSPPSSAWSPERFPLDCSHFSKAQFGSAIYDAVVDAVILILLVALYAHYGVNRVEAPFLIAILCVGFLSIGTFAGRIGYLQTKQGQYPPIGIVTPPVLKSIGMNAGIVATALLILCSSIERTTSTQSQPGLAMELESMRSWDKIPDLQYLTSETESISSAVITSRRSTQESRSSVSRRPSKPNTDVSAA